MRPPFEEKTIEEESILLFNLLTTKNPRSEYPFSIIYTHYYHLHLYGLGCTLRINNPHKNLKRIFSNFYTKIEKSRIVFDKLRIHVLNLYLMYIFNRYPNLAKDFDKKLKELYTKNIQALYRRELVLRKSIYSNLPAELKDNIRNYK